jgi:NADPH-dependent curcumin reductase CurA
LAARESLNQLFEGSNTGKLLIKVAEPAGEPVAVS